MKGCGYIIFVFGRNGEMVMVQGGHGVVLVVGCWLLLVTCLLLLCVFFFYTVFSAVLREATV